MAVFWGVDSGVNANEEVLLCVQRNFGEPDFWGRYLSTVPNASEGLTKEELRFLRSKGIKVMPIYNDFNNPVGRHEGRVMARNAIYHARRLGIRKGTVIFANVERFHEADAEWLIGWVETFYSSSYRPGFYHDPMVGNFHSAYCEAIQKEELVKNQAILWSAKPEKGISTKRSKPKFNPMKPRCPGSVWAWQYGRDAKVCPIDTNLADEKLFNLMH
ncbi:DUF1906 domain-containing protein [Neobacillus cucumis]|uniref:glycoside hydrolase domain-containing protein n=1 Tax=Neobacillus cucumis TaxID=1740721 RepID=UPI0018E032C3|nr:glycoside hydrolase domain-containing protein [Neobacillus cucumis]MBI0579238.1 DUF1906 domain-containing protein [Neobacillus cucumis]